MTHQDDKDLELTRTIALPPLVFILGNSVLLGNHCVPAGDGNL